MDDRGVALVRNNHQDRLSWWHNMAPPSSTETDPASDGQAAATAGDQLQAPSIRAPAARRSVSFGPASSSPPLTSTPMMNGATAGATILDQVSGSAADLTAGQTYRSDRRVASGSASSVISATSVGMTPSGSTSSSTAGSGGAGAGLTGLTALKPALKPGTERKRLPPPSQYQHGDPLIRRLRLVDDAGHAVNLKEFFKKVKIVAFYFSSQWAGQPLKEYHSTISEFAREHQHEFKVVYVSVDVDEQWYRAGTKGQPWVSMVWNDGSSLPSPSTTNATSPPSTTAADEGPGMYNNEDFLLAQEIDIDESLAKTDTAGEAYLRPFSRVHLASKLNIIAAPTLCVYSLERQKMLDWNVRMARLHRYQRDETWGRWSRGESAKSFGLLEAMQNSPGTMALVAFALVYWLMILAGGQEFNFLRRAVMTLDKSGAGGGAMPGSEKLQQAIQGAKEHLEF